MNFVDKEDVPLVEICQQRRKVPRLFNGWPGSDADIDAHLLRNNTGQRCFSKSRRAVEQHMVQ